MQLTKTVHDDENSLFPEHSLLQDISSPSQTQHQRKTSSSLKHQNQLLLNQDSHSVLSNINSDKIRFYEEYKKIYTVSYHLSIEKNRQKMILDDLVKRIGCLESKIQETRQRDLSKRDLLSDINRVKRSRRTAQQIEKKYKCEVMYCERFYGSEGSLQQHIKLKHPELYQKLHGELIVGQNSDSIF